MKGNLEASVLQRLLNLSRARGEEYEQVLVRYVAERFLYRLSRSPHASDFLLKGAMLFLTWDEIPHRVTRDIDLLGAQSTSVDGLQRIMSEIAAQLVEPDGVTFDVAGISSEAIRTAHAYGGVRVLIHAKLGKARVRLQVDVGFGDAVVPDPVALEFPSLLGLPRASMHGYCAETVIAEKALAMVELGLLNSRLKDYYDILHLCRKRSFEGPVLVAAMEATARKRGVRIPTVVIPGLTAEYAHDPARIMQWQGFCSRLKSELRPGALHAVVEELAEFLRPIFRAAASGAGLPMQWPPKGPWQ